MSPIRRRRSAAAWSRRRFASASHEIAREHPEKMILADSRIRVEHFRNVILKPNQQEADAACAAVFGQVDYQRLRAARRIRFAVRHARRGRRAGGRAGQEKHWFQPGRSKPVDICGAGDSFSAGAGVALAITGSAGRSGALRQSGRIHHDHEKGHRHREPGRSAAAAMHILAIDIGGTKFSDGRLRFRADMLVRESRATDREGGRDWMLDQIAIHCARVALGSSGSRAAASALAARCSSTNSASRCPRTWAAGAISICRLHHEPARRPGDRG